MSRIVWLMTFSMSVLSRIAQVMIVVVTEPSGSKQEKTPARTAESNIEERRTAVLNRIEVGSVVLEEIGENGFSPLFPCTTVASQVRM